MRGEGKIVVAASGLSKDVIDVFLPGSDSEFIVVDNSSVVVQNDGKEPKTRTL